MSVHQASYDGDIHYDGWDPSLMNQLQGVRWPYRVAYDGAWRKERLFRYLYWLARSERPDFNLFGSWTNDDITKEIALWSDIAHRRLSVKEAADELQQRLESLFGMLWPAAQQVGSSIELATVGLPVWNVKTQSLVPGNLGELRIYTAKDYEPEAPGLGQSFVYRSADQRHRLTLYLYSTGETDISAGTVDSRTLAQAQQALHDALTHVQGLNGTIVGDVVTAMEVLCGRFGGEHRMFGAGFAWQPSDGDPAWEALSVGEFRSGFIKQRYSTALALTATGAAEAVIREVNSDFADFLSMFGNQRFAEEPIKTAADARNLQ